MSRQPTHRISLSVSTTSASWSKLWDMFNNWASELRNLNPRDVSLTSTYLDPDYYQSDDSEEFFDERTMFKVNDALVNTGLLTPTEVREAITAMQNAGILFRKRRP